MRTTQRVIFASILLGGVVPGATLSAQNAPSSSWFIDAQTRCYVSHPDSRPADQVTWSGDCASGKAGGAGTATFMKSGRFVSQVTGNFVDGAASGRVRADWSDGAHYEGDEQDGRFNGQGVLTTADGDRFEGQWSNGRLNGHGTVKWANGDRYDGDWRDSKADGHGVQVWADGRKYDGAWKNDLPNGHGLLTRKDGSVFEGEFADGEPKPAAMAGPATPPAGASPSVPVAALNPGGTTPKTSAAGRWIDALAGLELHALDGSSVRIALSENGLSRQVAHGAGSTDTVLFTFVNSKQGTVSNAQGASQAIGVFRLGDTSLDIDYADGRSETLAPVSGGGLSMSTRTGGAVSCLAWYPAGHEFSTADKQAALADYANRLGLSPAPGKKAPVGAGCAPPAASAATAPAPAAQPSSYRSVHGKHGRPAASHTAWLDDGLSASGSIMVRSSPVHLIDTADNASATDNGAGRGSDCLHVDVDGTNWGFRNACAFPVQVAWCEMGGSDERNSCDGGGIAGAVAGKGFDALFADSNIRAEHDLRWISCEGDAGDVVPRLVHADPPAGRCVKAQTSWTTATIGK